MRVLLQAVARGCDAVYGLELFLWQARLQSQFILFGLQQQAMQEAKELPRLVATSPFLKEVERIRSFEGDSFSSSGSDGGSSKLAGAPIWVS